MSLHDYACYQCEKTYEVHVPIDKIDKVVKCPVCGKALVKRIAPVRILRYGNG